MTTLPALRRELTKQQGKMPTDRIVLWRMTGGRCFWCDGAMNLNGDPLSPRYMTIDHLHTRGSGLYNPKAKMASCRSCNEERGALPASVYWEIWAHRLSGRAVSP